MPACTSETCKLRVAPCKFIAVRDSGRINTYRGILIENRNKENTLYQNRSTLRPCHHLPFAIESRLYLYLVAPITSLTSWPAIELCKAFTA